MTTKQTYIDQFARHVSSGKVKFFEMAGIDFVLGRREGPYLWDYAGEKRLIDCHCNGGVFNLGHRHPAVVAALRENLASLDIGNHHLISAERAKLAAQLADLTPPELTYTVFGVGGGEAIDLAIKVARGFTGRPEIVSVKGGYHGHTGLALAAGDEKYYRPFGAPAPGFRQVPFGDGDALATAVSPQTAAVILETIPATSGMPLPPDGYLLRVRQICEQNGALLILDEVQAGLGRAGKLWAFEHFDVTPDIMVIGKGLSGGLYPITATILRADLEAVFHADPFIHISTFGGAELGCAVAAKVLEISSAPAFLQHVNEMAALFAEGFVQLQAAHPSLVRLRQKGLMMGIEMENEFCGPFFTKAAYDHGLLSVYANNDKRVAQLLPPLIIDRALTQEILERVDGALTQVEQILQQITG
ncbi:MAG TPA: aspartate aminotransferase family protein [Anaerolineae bacterium]|nr:aspartate aminotransferase family protein [Anaerolineae bacterium]